MMVDNLRMSHITVRQVTDLIWDNCRDDLNLIHIEQIDPIVRSRMSNSIGIPVRDVSRAVQNMVYEEIEDESNER